MRTVVYAETGGPEVLRLTDEPVPEPGPGELRVRVRRSGVNPTDWKSRAGRGPGKPVDPPQIPGQDGAGQGLLAKHMLAREHRSQGPCRRHAEGMHGFGHDVFAEHRPDRRPAITPA